jgi:hypothetical protein
MYKLRQKVDEMIEKYNLQIDALTEEAQMAFESEPSRSRGELEAGQFDFLQKRFNQRQTVMKEKFIAELKRQLLSMFVHSSQYYAPQLSPLTINIKVKHYFAQIIPALHVFFQSVHHVTSECPRESADSLEQAFGCDEPSLLLPLTMRDVVFRDICGFLQDFFVALTEVNSSSLDHYAQRARVDCMQSSDLGQLLVDLHPNAPILPLKGVSSIKHVLLDKHIQDLAKFVDHNVLQEAVLLWTKLPAAYPLDHCELLASSPCDGFEEIDAAEAVEDDEEEEDEQYEGGGSSDAEH